MTIALVIIGLLVCAIGVVVYEQDKKIKFLEAQLEGLENTLEPAVNRLEDFASKQ